MTMINDWRIGIMLCAEIKKKKKVWTQGENNET